MTREQRLLLVFGGLGIGAGFAYWGYLKLQDPENAPGLSDVIETLKSYFSRANLIASDAIGGVTGGSSYMDKAAALVAKFEGFSAKAYNDVGKLAIGYGHDVRPGDPYTADSVISESEAFTLLQQDLQSADTCIGQRVTVDLTDNQRAALISFVYNIGCGAFASSTLLRDVNAGDFQSAYDQFAVWIHAGGAVSDALVSRRQSEADYFAS